MNRRLFLKRAALAAGALPAASYLPNLLAESASTRKLNCVQIGCGGRGMNHLEAMLTQSSENLVAIVDPDEKQHAKVKAWLKKRQVACDNLQTFTDYRVMFDRIGKDIDAVFIATPNHHHAEAAALAIEHGRAVYCEKPLTHDIAEARRLREMARNSKAPTQMGNQGHCEDGYRRLCEFIWSGVIGNVTETHSYTDRANGGGGPRPPTLPVPAGMHWDQWIGPAPFRDYHADLHPHQWHDWYDFGNGSLGNMGCHVLDGVFWALKIGHPLSVEAEEMREGTDEQYPTGARLRWDVPAREGMPALKAYWYEGLKKDAKQKPGGNLHAASGDARNLPPLMAEMVKKYPDEEFDKSSGTFYVGDKGIIYTGTYGGHMHVLPMEKMSQYENVPKTLSRPRNIFTNFLNAVRTGTKETEASFEYGSRLTEFTLLGNLAQHAGVGKKVEWDGEAMAVKNLPELNRWVKCPRRTGWTA